MSLTSLLRGKNAEQRAASYLRQQGLKILAKNVRYKCGEIDIIAGDKDNHIFVEVKYRGGDGHGAATEMVSADKQAKLTKAAKLWLQENDPQFAKGCRFDVIAITKSSEAARVSLLSRSPSIGHDQDIHWIKNAFSPELW